MVFLGNNLLMCGFAMSITNHPRLNMILDGYSLCQRLNYADRYNISAGAPRDDNDLKASRVGSNIFHYTNLGWTLRLLPI